MNLNQLYFSLIFFLFFSYGNFSNAQKARMVHDLNTVNLPVGTEPEGFTLCNNQLFFSAQDSDLGRELWVLNANGEVRMVSDIYPGKEGSHPRDITAIGNTLYFSAEDGVHGRVLWHYNAKGELALVCDSLQRERYSHPGSITPYLDGILFTAHNEKRERDCCDGFTAVYYLHEDSLEMVFNHYVSTVYCTNGSLNRPMVIKDDGIFCELDYVELGSLPSIVKITSDDYFQIGEGELSTARDITEYKNDIFFLSFSENNRRGLYTMTSDSTFKQLKAFQNEQDSWYNNNLRVLDDRLWFQVIDSLGNQLVYTFDGSEIYQLKAEEWNGNLKFDEVYGMLNESLFLVSEEEHPEGFEEGGNADDFFYKKDEEGFYSRSRRIRLLKFYNRENNTIKVARSGDDILDVNFSKGYAVWNGYLYFHGNDGKTGPELWRADEDGRAELVFDYTTGSEGSAIVRSAFCDDRYYFVVDSGLYNSKLYFTKGRQINEISIDSLSDIKIRGMKAFNNRLFFQTIPLEGEPQVWFVDSTSNVQSINYFTQKNPFLWATDLSLTSGRLSFTGAKHDGMPQRWELEGNDQIVSPIGPIVEAIELYFVKYDDFSIYSRAEKIQRFQTQDRQMFDQMAYKLKDAYALFMHTVEHGLALWIYSDDDLPRLYTDLYPGQESNLEYLLFHLNDKLVFKRTENESFQWLYMEGRDSLQIFAEFDRNNFPERFIRFNDKIYFECLIDAAIGRELYSIDENGAVELVSDINPGEGGSNIKEMYQTDNRLYVHVIQNNGELLLEVDAENSVKVVENPDGQPLMVSGFEFLHLQDEWIVFWAEKDKKNTIYAYNGTSPTQRIANFEAKIRDVDAGHFSIVNGELFFTADDGKHGKEVWCCPLK